MHKLRNSIHKRYQLLVNINCKIPNVLNLAADIGLRVYPPRTTLTMGIDGADTNASVDPNRSWIDPMPILMPAAAQKFCKQVTMMLVRGSKPNNLLHFFLLFTSQFEEFLSYNLYIYESKNRKFYPTSTISLNMDTNFSSN